MNPSPKQLLIKNDELRAKTAAVVNSDWFKIALTHVRAQLLTDTTNMTPETQRGMRLYEETLLSISEVPNDTQAVLGSGIEHKLDELSLRERKPQNEQPKK